MTTQNSPTSNTDPASGQHAPDEIRSSGATGLLLAWLAGTALAPFVHAIATQGAQDLYAQFRRRLSSSDHDRARRQIEEQRELILVDESARAVLRIPSAVQAEDAYALAAARVPVQGPNEWIEVAWEESGSSWTIRRIDAQPSDAINVRPASGEANVSGGLPIQVEEPLRQQRDQAADHPSAPNSH